MIGEYEFWFTDDAGRKLFLLDKYAFVNYSRSTAGYGTIQFGMPLLYYQKQNLNPFFRPDMRIDVWRSPAPGFPRRREGSFFLRKFEIYQRETDSMQIIEFMGRSPIDILRRQYYQTDGEATATVDDFMKNMVRAMFVNNAATPGGGLTAPFTRSGVTLTYTGEFAVDANSSDGPTVTDNFYLKNVLDAVTDLKKASLIYNRVSSVNRRIFFDVIEDEAIGLAGGFGYRFRTFRDRRGVDRTTSPLIFSVDNGNLAQPSYYEDYLDEYTGVSGYSFDNPSSTFRQFRPSAAGNDQYLSRWNFIEKSFTSQWTYATGGSITNQAYIDLHEGDAQLAFNGNFLNSPGSQIQPRSLYGVDWDLGDLLPVRFAGKTLSAEVAIVYVSLNESGVENISGQTQVGS